MKIVFKKLKGNVYNTMRRIGYRFQGKNDEKSELIFTRPISAGDYPRFHIYLKIDNVSRETLLILHLDQKQPIYKGAPAHAAEYSGKVVKKEAERIKQTITGL